MGYDVYILKKNDYEDDEEESKITYDDWIRCTSQQPEFTVSEGYYTHFPFTDKAPVWMESPGHCSWVNEINKDENRWFVFDKGAVYTKNPDYYTLRKMVELSLSLNAKVQGQDMEFYTYEFIDTIEREEREKSKNNSTKPWWKFW